MASCPVDQRFNEEKCSSALSVSQQHDIQYEVNKLGSQAYAARHKVGIVHSVAKDSPSSEALRLQPDLTTTKLSWLQRHDRESKDMYGIWH